METPTEPGLSAIMSERRQLINLGYRLLGSLADAEDVVQETYARWYGLTARQRDAIDNPAAWLTTVAGRICLDQLRSARARRVSYVGEWIPEPLPDPEGDPADRVTLDESVNMAFLVVLEEMTPAERVAFVLHDVFCHPFNEVAEIVGRSPAACRQLATSARRRIRAARPTPNTPVSENADVVRSFKAAWEAKDINALIGLLDPDVVAISDGGGVVSALIDPLVGRDTVARHTIAILDYIPAMTITERTVNGQPGLVATRDGEVVSVMAFDVTDGRIRHMWAIRNPEKLRAWTD